MLLWAEIERVIDRSAWLSFFKKAIDGEARVKIGCFDAGRLQAAPAD